MTTTGPLTPDQRAFLEQPHYALLATVNPDGSPQQTLIWYLLEGDEIRFGIGAGSLKDRNMRRQPAVSLAIAANGGYLTVAGTATVEPVDPDLRYRLAVRYRGEASAKEWVKQNPETPRASVRLKITRVYGQR